jgi:mRNA interferase RelE/StbE
MNYQVKLHPKVKQFLDKSNKQLNERIKKRLKLLKEDPFRYLEHYEGEKCYKFRIGDYRALIDVDNQRKIIFVRVLDHRGKIYKRT